MFVNAIGGYQPALSPNRTSKHKLKIFQKLDSFFDTAQHTSHTCGGSLMYLCPGQDADFLEMVSICKKKTFHAPFRRNEVIIQHLVENIQNTSLCKFVLMHMFFCNFLGVAVMEIWLAIFVGYRCCRSTSQLRNCQKMLKN